MRRQRLTAAATKAQTRAYGLRLAELVPVLRQELDAPPVPHGRPVVVVLMGAPGVGKSHCARLLCASIGAAHVSSDHLRSRLFIAASYAPAESATVFRAADALLDALLAEGHRAVLDATNLLARNRAAATAAARHRGVPLVHVRVVAEERDALARLAERRRSRREGDHSDADESVYRRMDRFEPPAEEYLELRNGPNVAGEVARVAAEVERRCARGS
jgi:predicted kinase